MEYYNWQRYRTICFPLMWLAHCQIDYTVASGDKQQAKRAKVRANGASQMLIPQKVTGIFDWWLWCISITKDTFYQHLVGMSHWLVGGRWVGFHFVMCPHPVPLYGLARRLCYPLTLLRLLLWSPPSSWSSRCTFSLSSSPLPGPDLCADGSSQAVWKAESDK